MESLSKRYSKGQSLKAHPLVSILLLPRVKTPLPLILIIIIAFFLSDFLHFHYDVCRVQISFYLSCLGITGFVESVHQLMLFICSGKYLTIIFLISSERVFTFWDLNVCQILSFYSLCFLPYLFFFSHNSFLQAEFWMIYSNLSSISIILS